MGTNKMVTFLLATSPREFYYWLTLSVNFKRLLKNGVNCA